MKAKRLCKLATYLLCLSLLIMLPGCKAKSGEEFTIPLPRDISTLDPQAAKSAEEKLIISEIFEGLCRIDEDGDAVPGVATRWESDKSGSRFTFHLRKAKWSDGTAVTAEDFVFGIARALRSETGGSNVQDLFVIKNARAVYEGTLDESALGVTAKNDRTLVIELEYAYPDFPLLTAGLHYMPCSAEFFEACAGHYGLSAEYVLTNGPFALAGRYAWDTDYNERSVKLAASSTYKGERKAEPESVTYQIDYDDAIDNDPLSALSSGTVDVYRIAAGQREAAQEQKIATVSVGDSVTGLLLNTDCENLENLYIREIFIKTIDREDLLSRGAALGKEAQGIMPSTIQWDGKAYYSDGETRFVARDLEITGGMDSLLDALGRSKMPSITVLCPDDPDSIEVANGLLATWNNTLGTSFNMLPVSEQELNYRVRTGNYEAALYSLQAGGAAPIDMLSRFSSESVPCLFESEEFDARLKDLQFTRESFKALEDWLAEQYVFYPLFESETVYGVNPKTAWIQLIPDGRIEMAGAKKRK